MLWHAYAIDQSATLGGGWYCRKPWFLRSRERRSCRNCNIWQVLFWSANLVVVSTLYALEPLHTHHPTNSTCRQQQQALKVPLVGIVQSPRVLILFLSHFQPPGYLGRPVVSKDHPTPRAGSFLRFLY